MAITVTAYGEKYIVDVDGYATVETLEKVTTDKANLESELAAHNEYSANKTTEYEAKIAEKTTIIAQMT